MSEDAKNTGILLSGLLQGALSAGFTIAIFLSFDLAGLAREIEMGIAIALGFVVLFALNIAFQMVTQKESSAEEMLRNAGLDADGETMRAARAVEKAKLRLAMMHKLSQSRMPEFQRAIADFEAQMVPLLDDILKNPSTRRRASNLMRRTMPRLFEAVETYVKYADEGTDLVDPTEMRKRVIAALQTAGQQAEQTRLDGLESTEQGVEIALEILEGSFAFSKH